MMLAESIAKALGGRKAGSGWTARCLAHDDRTPSLSIRVADNGKVLVRCHAGCHQGRVIAALRARGLWDKNSRQFVFRTERREPVEHKLDQGGAQRSEVPLAIWQSAKPAPGTLVEIYLASRGIEMPLPGTVRFYPGLKHPAGSIWPAMVGLVTGGVNGMPKAIHRTFLARDGAGKAPVGPREKMMLGPCRGGAVRLAEPGEVLLIGEGIETCLSAMQAAGHPAWAALSTSGLRGLDLPGNVRDVLVLADGDDAGEAAARDCAVRWKRQGRRVRIARPPVGADFNDLLNGRVASVGEGAQ
jgi:putative DNA primase/helicase